MLEYIGNNDIKTVAFINQNIKIGLGELSKADIKIHSCRFSVEFIPIIYNVRIIGFLNISHIRCTDDGDYPASNRYYDAQNASPG